MASTVNGISQVLAKLKQIKAEASAALDDGLLEAGLIIERESLERTPKDTGFLRNSIYTNAIGRVQVEVGYTAEYAPEVHENMQAHHPTGEAKFLENAVKAKEQAALNAVKSALERATGGQNG